MVPFEQEMFGMSLGQWHGFDWPGKFTIDAWHNAPYDADLEKLIPIIWHHGYAANHEFYTALLMEYASHGYLVVALNDSTGNTCPYTEKPDGTPVPYKNTFDGLSDVRNSEGKFEEEFPHQMEIVDPRVEYTKKLIDEFEAGEFVKIHLESDTALDMSKLVVGGHSFGGNVTLVSAIRDRRIKCAIADDPYIGFALPTVNVEAELNLAGTALHCIETEHFASVMDTNPFKFRNKFLEVNTKEKNQEYIYFKGHGHSHPSDLSLLDPDLIQMSAMCGCHPCSGRELAI